MSDEMDGCIGQILAYIIIAGIVIAIVVYIIIPFLIGVGAIGGVWGGGVAIKNYAVSFKNNVNFR